MENTERVCLIPGEEALHQLSVRARTILHVITAWIDQLPAGTVDMTYTLFPSDDDYGSELLVTFDHTSLPVVFSRLV